MKAIVEKYCLNNNYFAIQKANTVTLTNTMRNPTVSFKMDKIDIRT